MNRYRPHIIVIPEDDAIRNFAVGFVKHDAVVGSRVRVVNPAGGWKPVVDLFQREYVNYLSNHADASVVVVIDFDGQPEGRRAAVESEIPESLRSRVYLLGPRSNAEGMKREFGGKTFEQIGMTLADECAKGTDATWANAELQHNLPERDRALQCIRNIIFDE